MKKSEKNNNLGHYDTTINIIGGLRDSSLIINGIVDHFKQYESSSGQGDTSPQQELLLRTEKSRKRVERAINLSFLKFYNQDHRDLIKTLFQSNAPMPDKELVLFWQFALNNRLFREISTQVFTKVYFSGRTGFSKEDITAFLKDLLSKDPEHKPDWSESTIGTLSTKYLNLLTKWNFLEGVRKKSIKLMKPTAESLVIFLYLVKLFDPNSSNILSNEMLPLCFVPTEDVTERLKKLSLKGYFNMNFNGVALRIDLIHSYKGICNALYN